MRSKILALKMPINQTYKAKAKIKNKISRFLLC